MDIQKSNLYTRDVLKIKVYISQQIKKTIEQLTNNLNHPSLHNKNIKCKKADNLFSIRVNKQYRILYFVLPFTMFALAGFTNALNLIDELDGLAGSVSIIILSTFLYIGYINQDQLIIILTSTTITALCAFMFFNWNPASIFMGDSGSLFLGFIISLVAVISIQYIHPITILYLAAIPILDTIVVMIRRIRKGLSPFSPDKTHIHHILLNFFGKKVKKTVFFIALVQALFSLVGLMMALNSKTLGEGVSSLVAFIAFIGIVIFFYMIFTGIKRRQKLIEKLSNRKKKVK